MKILLIEHTCSEFVSSRLRLGVFLKKQGYNVYALVPNNGKEQHYKTIKNAGLSLLTYPYKRNDTNISSNLKRIKIFRGLIKEHQFDIVHSFKFQPNLYAAISSLGIRKSKLVLHITGLGVAFSDKKTPKIRILRFISQAIFLFNFIIADRLIFQNHDDEKELWLTSLFKKKHSVIEGSGVDIEKFDKQNFDIQALKNKRNLEDKFIMTFISRLVWQKGVREVVQAMKVLLEQYPNFYLQIVGNTDPKNPETVTEEFINENRVEGSIDFLGRRSDIPELLAISDLYVYPSYYREGLPRTGLEALATGLPIITTDSPGCNLLIEEGENGYLVLPKSAEAVKEAIEKIYNGNKMTTMGKRSREIAETKYQNEIIYKRIYSKYLEIL
ncbi:MAG: glycosyltransferase family 4 protein [Saprospiraceae bacterium]